MFCSKGGDVLISSSNNYINFNGTEDTNSNSYEMNSKPNESNKTQEKPFNDQQEKKLNENNNKILQNQKIDPNHLMNNQSDFCRKGFKGKQNEIINNNVNNNDFGIIKEENLPKIQLKTDINNTNYNYPKSDSLKDHQYSKNVNTNSTVVCPLTKPIFINSKLNVNVSEDNCNENNSNLKPFNNKEDFNGKSHDTRENQYVNSTSNSLLKLNINSSYSSRVSNLTWFNRYEKLNSYTQKQILQDNETLLKEHLVQLKSQVNDNKNMEEIIIYTPMLEKIQIKNSQFSYFTELFLHQNLLMNVEAMKFSTLTPIQKTVIPLLSEGNDIMGCSQTGSGKTVAFLLPIIDKMLKKGPPHCQLTPSKFIFII